MITRATYVDDRIPSIIQKHLEAPAASRTPLRTSLLTLHNDCIADAHGSRFTTGKRYNDAGAPSGELRADRKWSRSSASHNQASKLDSTISTVLVVDAKSTSLFACIEPSVTA